MSAGRNFDRARHADQLRRPVLREPQWWIVFARKGSRCAHCGCDTYGTPCAFEGGSQTLVCKACWERALIHPTPSKAYLAALKSETGRTKSQGRAARRRRKRAQQHQRADQP